MDSKVASTAALWATELRCLELFSSLCAQRHGGFGVEGAHAQPVLVERIRSCLTASVFGHSDVAAEADDGGERAAIATMKSSASLMFTALDSLAPFADVIFFADQRMAHVRFLDSDTIDDPRGVEDVNALPSFGLQGALLKWNLDTSTAACDVCIDRTSGRMHFVVSQRSVFSAGAAMVSVFVADVGQSPSTAASVAISVDRTFRLLATFSRPVMSVVVAAVHAARLIIGFSSPLDCVYEVLVDEESREGKAVPICVTTPGRTFTIVSMVFFDSGRRLALVDQQRSQLLIVDVATQPAVSEDSEVAPPPCTAMPLAEELDDNGLPVFSIFSVRPISSRSSTLVVTASVDLYIIDARACCVIATMRSSVPRAALPFALREMEADTPVLVAMHERRMLLGCPMIFGRTRQQLVEVPFMTAATSNRQ